MKRLLFYHCTLVHRGVSKLTTKPVALLCKLVSVPWLYFNRPEYSGWRNLLSNNNQVFTRMPVDGIANLNFEFPPKIKPAIVVSILQGMQ